jgi:hypothetical protein
MNKVLKCKKCGKEIQSGFYNTPDGAYCCVCWERTPQAVKDAAFLKAMKKLADTGKIIYNTFTE